MCVVSILFALQASPKICKINFDDDQDVLSELRHVKDPMIKYHIGLITVISCGPIFSST